MRIFAGLLLSLMLSGCGFWNVKHEPVTIAQPEAIQLTERLLWEQYRGWAPKEVEVTATHFRTIWMRRSATVYFDNIGDIKIAKNGDIYRVTIRDKTKHDLYTYYSVYPDKSRQFVDAVNSLRLAT
jgi:hypothetical protein